MMNMCRRTVKLHAYVTLYCIKPRQVAASGAHDFGGTTPRADATYLLYSLTDCGVRFPQVNVPLGNLTAAIGTLCRVHFWLGFLVFSMYQSIT